MSMEVASERSARAARAFEEAVAQAGGTVLEEKWLGSLKGHKVRCAKGHINSPRPNSVQQGQGICRTCGGQDGAESWRLFRERVASLGGIVLETHWLGTTTPHRVKCREGHEGAPRPSAVQAGQGICRPCANRDPNKAKQEFHERVAELGGVVLEPSWLGVMRPHRVRCAEGHEARPRPNAIQQGQGLCRTCVGNDPITAERNFRARVAALGGTLLESSWLGAGTPHRIKCSKGHEATARPDGVGRGEGICGLCKGKIWDVFYVVTDDLGVNVKFGITSGNPRHRLGIHARAGYTSVIRLLTGLPAGSALTLEKSVKIHLRQSGATPQRGAEYFSGHALPSILAVVDAAAY